MFSSVSAVSLITARFVPGIVSLCYLCLLAVELVLTSVHSIKREVNTLSFQSNTQVYYRLHIYGIDCHSFEVSCHLKVQQCLWLYTFTVLEKNEIKRGRDIRNPLNS